MNERIKQIIDYYGLNTSQFEKKIFSSNGSIRTVLNRGSSLNVSTVIRILENCPEISPDWLLLGRGEMLRKNTQISETTPPKPYNTDDETASSAAESQARPISEVPNKRRSPQPQPLNGCPWERYDAAREEIGSLRERLAQASATIASLKVQLDNEREKTPSASPSATTATEPILV